MCGRTSYCTTLTNCITLSFPSHNCLRGLKMMPTKSMMKSALRRQNGRHYFSCLAAITPSSRGTNTNRCASAIQCPRLPLPHVSLSNNPCHRYVNTPSLAASISNFSYFNDMSHHMHQNSTQPQRFFSAVPTSSDTASAIENTPLGSPEGAALLQGLDIHTVPSKDDGHPLAVYTIEENDINDNEQQKQQRTPVLLLHGRTWSSVPVYHLVGGSKDETSVEGGAENNRSLIQALYNSQHIQPYAMDFRGFGGTPKDESGFVQPLRCVSDVVSVLKWIQERHNNNNYQSNSGDNVDVQQPALLGWSHGALIAQITAQRHPEALSKLILYGSTYNPNVKYSIPPPDAPHTGHTDHEDFPLRDMATRNEYDGAMEDFTNVSNNEARIFPPLSAKLFAETALVSDPIKVQWCNLHQLNECRPSLVKVPTMVIAGDQDPYAPIQTQAELFTNLGKGVDRVWSIIANADHAVHLSDERHRLVENMNNFLGTRGF